MEKEQGQTAVAEHEEADIHVLRFTITIGDTYFQRNVRIEDGASVKDVLDAIQADEEFFLNPTNEGGILTKPSDAGTILLGRYDIDPMNFEPMAAEIEETIAVFHDGTERKVLPDGSLGSVIE